MKHFRVIISTQPWECEYYVVVANEVKDVCDLLAQKVKYLAGFDLDFKNFKVNDDEYSIRVTEKNSYASIRISELPNDPVMLVGECSG